MSYILSVQLGAATISISTIEASGNDPDAIAHIFFSCMRRTNRCPQCLVSHGRILDLPRVLVGSTSSLRTYTHAHTHVYTHQHVRQRLEGHGTPCRTGIALDTHPTCWNLNLGWRPCSSLCLANLTRRATRAGRAVTVPRSRWEQSPGGHRLVAVAMESSRRTSPACLEITIIMARRMMKLEAPKVVWQGPSWMD